MGSKAGKAAKRLERLEPNLAHIHVGKNKHVTEGHLTIFVNAFPNFSQSISNNHYFSLWYTGPTISYL